MLNYPIRLNDKLSGLYGVASGGNGMLSKQFGEVFADLSAKADIQLGRLNEIYKRDIPRLNRLMYEKQVPVIGEPKD